MLATVLLAVTTVLAVITMWAGLGFEIPQQPARRVALVALLTGAAALGLVAGVILTAWLGL